MEAVLVWRSTQTKGGSGGEGDEGDWIFIVGH